jgi:hypothetical protein
MKKVTQKVFKIENDFESMDDVDLVRIAEEFEADVKQHFVPAFPK